jgi:predicted secreted protein
VVVIITAYTGIASPNFAPSGTFKIPYDKGMISQKDIFISAQLLIKQHGAKAEDYASKKMMNLIEKDDAKGAGVWLSIMSAIEDLRSIKQQGKLH